MTTTTPRPLILDGSADVDLLGQYEHVMIPVRNLREGMLLIDPELCTPVYFLDHRVRATRGSGSHAWFVHDLHRLAGAGPFTTTSFHENKTVPVAVRVIG